jgi:hypothetical protein
VNWHVGEDSVVTLEKYVRYLRDRGFMKRSELVKPKLEVRASIGGKNLAVKLNE